MAKFVYICFREPSDAAVEAAHVSIQEINKRICPDNLDVEPASISSDSGVLAGIFSPSDAVSIIGSSVCLGKTVDGTRWQELNQPAPSGVYLIARSDSDFVEIVTDTTASRTAWYFMDEQVFVASSSQRALTMLLGDFRPNKVAISWILSTGSIGPYAGWDSRIQRVNSNTTLALDRRSWTLSIDTKALLVDPIEASPDEHRSLLAQLLSRSVRRLSFDLDRWILALSGGADSRGLLYLLAQTDDGDRLKTLTWGLESSTEDYENDAQVAAELAIEMNVSHSYHPTETSQEPIKALLGRFITCGEGCIDHIAGYMDGFELWRDLHSRGIHGVIRGDQLFGGKPVSEEADVWHSMGVWRWDEFENLPLASDLGLENIRLPEKLQRQRSETLESWRDRLRYQFRLPVFVAALSELKTPYVEIVSPFLMGDVISHMLAVPDHLRTSKTLYHSLFHASAGENILGPEIPFAKYRAIGFAKSLLKKPEFVDFLRDELLRNNTTQVVPEPLVQYVLEHLRVKSPPRTHWKKTLRLALESAVPASRTIFQLKKKLFNKTPFMDVNVLAFRIVMILRMYELLTEDSEFRDTKLRLN